MKDSLWLAMDLSSPSATMALWEPTSRRVLAEEALPPVAGQLSSHSEQCLPTLQRLLAGRPLGDITRYVVPAGPGSFTGLRIALSTVKAFAMVTGRPIETMSGAEARAKAWVRGKTDAPERVVAVSQVATGEYARYVLGGEETTVKVESPDARGLVGGDGALLLDERLPEMAAVEGIVVVRFPLRAAHLAAALDGAVTRRTYSDFAGWVEATPRYFGGDRFR